MNVFACVLATNLQSTKNKFQSSKNNFQNPKNRKDNIVKSGFKNGE